MGLASTPSDAKESQNSGSITSPLRISKRESPGPTTTQLARRTSSSYKHVRNNNLVTKSPFKSQIPMPSTPTRPSSVVFPLTRRVSGEKRPRPQSIHEQAETENERPFALKRERRQSKGIQNLLDREPVSKSPFRLRQYGVSSQHQIPSVPSVLEPDQPVSSSSQYSEEPVITLRGHIPSAALSPARSSLVSRRLHGPRISGSGRRECRKTVTFVDRCEVLEFAPDEEEVFGSADDEMGEGSDLLDEEDPFFQGYPTCPDDAAGDDASFESIHIPDVEVEGNNLSLLRLDPDVSVTGLVDDMFASNAASEESSAPTGYSTPPRATDVPPDLGTENGHADLSHQPSQPEPHFSPSDKPSPSMFKWSPSVPNSPCDFPFGLGLSPRASPLSQPSTPPRRSPTTSIKGTPPLGRTTHAERVRQAREEEKSGQPSADDDVGRLPVSPSPMKKPSVLGTLSDMDIIAPHFNLSSGAHKNEDATSRSPSSLDQADDSLNLSIGNSEISLTGLGRDPEASISNGENVQEISSPERYLGDEPFRSLSPRPMVIEGSRSSPLARGHSCSPSAIPPRMSSPLFRSGSPLLAIRNRSGSNGSLTSRQRITREDVQRRLLTRRSVGSPTPDIEPEPRTPSNIEGAEGVFKLAENEVQSESLDESVPVREPFRCLELGQSEKRVESPQQSARVHVQDDQESNPSSNDTGLSLIEASSEDLTILRRQEATSDKLESLGLLTRSTGEVVNMGSVSSGSSGKSSETAVEAPAPLIKIEFKDADMDMKSALDRLMDDVAGVGGREGEDSIMTECESYEATVNRAPKPTPAFTGAMPEPTPLLHTSTGVGFSPDKDSSREDSPPAPPPKDKIKHREQLILEKRREMRQWEADFDEESAHSREHSAAPRPASPTKTKCIEQRLLGVGRPSRRRSMSTGDAEAPRKRKGEGPLDVAVGESNNALADSIEQELKKLVEPPKKAKYQVREREGMIYASSSEPDGVTHMSGPGDVNTGKAWRTVRRPSDMNEYSKLIKEYRAQEKPGKAYGKVFVKIVGIKNTHLPLPKQATSLTCTLNNGIHFVTTPECQLSQSTRIDQEFELIEHSKLEFTLTLKVKRDPHITAEFKELSPPPPPPQVPIVPAPSRGGMRSFFSSSPKKPSTKSSAQPVSPPVYRLPENLARYMKPDGTLARAFVAFKDVAARCDTRLFETSYPLIGQRLETGGKFSTKQVGELVLQIFRLPPLPGIAPDQIPQSLDECCRGLRHLNWHKVTYFEGTLTQYGGGCMTWKRRRFRVIGANLVAFNDITKKATATIDLKKAIAIEDDQQGRGTAISPGSTRYDDDYLCGVERSFRLIFPNDEIVFFADSDEEKAKWLEIFRALVGHIPPHPLWGELLWQRQEDLSKRAQAQVISQIHPSNA